MKGILFPGERLVGNAGSCSHAKLTSREARVTLTM